MQATNITYSSLRLISIRNSFDEDSCVRSSLQPLITREQMFKFYRLMLSWEIRNFWTNITTSNGCSWNQRKYSRTHRFGNGGEVNEPLNPRDCLFGGKDANFKLLKKSITNLNLFGSTFRNISDDVNYFKITLKM